MKTLPSNKRITYKNADEADIVDYYGERPAFSVKAIIFYLDGEPMGLAGWKIEGGSYVVFSEIKEGVKVEKTTIYRCGKILMKMVAEHGCPMYARTQNQKLLETFGFKPVDMVSNNKEFYQWHN